MKKYIFIAVYAVIQMASNATPASAQLSKTVKASGPIAANNQTNTGVKIGGEVKRPFSLTAADMKQFDRLVISRKDRDNKDHQYSGASLLSILQKAGATTGKELRGENLTKYAIVEASDGYQVLFSLAELDKEFTDREVILADQMDGQALPAADGPFRIIIQDEKKPARCIKQVTAITLAFAK